ncbi:hypothetical protein [Actinomadura sp. J1-007]|uniref:hypothetical protein n=1 Tax=Actinomadura sp. J1-007 TaxID=2661913 RepID=UPI00136EDCCE|nr:hypothetical protein [Actinomadura sp. J1-007]
MTKRGEPGLAEGLFDDPAADEPAPGAPAASAAPYASPPGAGEAPSSRWPCG